MSSWLARFLGITPKQVPFSVNDATFEQEVLRSELPVLLDVWGASCGPCKQLEPVIMDLAASYHGRVKGCSSSAPPPVPSRPSASPFAPRPRALLPDRRGALERVHGFRSSLFHRETIAQLFGV